MIKTEAVSDYQLFNPTKAGAAVADIIAHPARSAAGQKLAGSGELVFEGELLEMPFRWHPGGQEELAKFRAS